MIQSQTLMARMKDLNAELQTVSEIGRKENVFG